MPSEQIITLLIQERDRLNRAIEALQGPTKRLGRPPKNPDAIAAPTAAAGPAAAPAPVRKKPHFSDEQRQAAAERMRQMWARKKAAAAQPKAAKKRAKKTAKAA